MKSVTAHRSTYVLVRCGIAVFALLACGCASVASEVNLDIAEAPQMKGFKLRVELTDGPPEPGTAVLEQLPFKPYAGGKLKHRLYLPTNWVKGKTYPVLVEYLGNGGSVDKSGSPMAHGLSGGEEFILVTLPFVEKKLTEVPTGPDAKGRPQGGMGDVAATVAYAKAAVPWICKTWGGDPERVLLLGFSRGAIACNAIGLHDDEIAALWRGMVMIDHYDAPGDDAAGFDAEDAKAKRLQRLGMRHQLICGHMGADESSYDTKVTANYHKEHQKWEEQMKARNEELIAKAKRYASVPEAIAGLKLKPCYEIDGVTAFVAKYLPRNNITFLPLPYAQHQPGYFLRDIHERQVAVEWLNKVLTGPRLPPGNVGKDAGQ